MQLSLRETGVALRFKDIQQYLTKKGAFNPRVKKKPPPASPTVPPWHKSWYELAATLSPQQLRPGCKPPCTSSCWALSAPPIRMAARALLAAPHEGPAAGELRNGLRGRKAARRLWASSTGWELGAAMCIADLTSQPADFCYDLDQDVCFPDTGAVAYACPPSDSLFAGNSPALTSQDWCLRPPAARGGGELGLTLPHAYIAWG
ncbi:hypothetical protein CYMTET_24368 [Cymbomonas tetramitiformis]|uniref:Uncharacterized protein n=1 Tax=Cymbomonas tetramitiformis TaxID=36881 RepID=A0AAE0FWQ1_9CHLO|nr:hypothetical protein CYMTET_24368 [Cymbomonas tetramitiformis]